MKNSSRYRYVERKQKEVMQFKKFIAAVLIIGSFVVYSFVFHTNNAVLVPTTTPKSTTSIATSTPTSSSSTPLPSATNTPVASTPTSSTANAQYKDGTFVGSQADAHWGTLQVQAIIKGGKIVDVQFLQYPNDRNRSVQINSYADPQLTSEAIQAQSAQVDIISGATDSSDAFIQSLSDALTQAKA